MPWATLPCHAPPTVPARPHERLCSHQRTTVARAIRKTLKAPRVTVMEAQTTIAFAAAQRRLVTSSRRHSAQCKRVTVWMGPVWRNIHTLLCSLRVSCSREPSTVTMRPNPPSQALDAVTHRCLSTGEHSSIRLSVRPSIIYQHCVHSRYR